MKKRILLTAALFIGIILLVHPYVYTSSSGPSVGHTGAPKESTCASPYCHGQFPVNSSDGLLSIKLLDNQNEVQQYIPGNKYKIRVELSKTSTARWGFQSTVRASSNTDVTAGIIKSTGTDVKTLNSGSKTYITHTKIGSGQQNWEFEWTAPASGTGEVTIFTAGNAANGNNNPSGDYIYTKQLKIAEDQNVSVAELPVFNSLKVFPNPVSEIITFTFTNENPGVVEAHLLDIKGNHINNLFYGKKSAGEQQISADIDGIAAGTYLVQLVVDGKSAFRKIVIK